MPGPTVDASSFVDPADAAPGVRDALRRCREVGAGRLAFGPGTYHFRPGTIPTSHRWLSNNDGGDKRVALAVEGLTGLTIDGRGARFVFHGRILPVFVEDCVDVTVTNLTLTVDRPFFSQGDVVDSTPDSCDLRIDAAAFPWHVAGDRLVFTSPTWESDYIDNMLEFDLDTRAPILGCRDNIFRDDPPRARLLGPGLVRLTGAFRKQAEPGRAMVIKHERRDNPAIVLSRSRDVAVRDVTVHQSGTMGVLAQMCTDVALTGVRVLPDPATDHLVSTNTDATHLVHCRGTVEIRDCRFESQLDDATNVHTSYLRVVERTSPTTLVAAIGHHQQAGIQHLRPGDALGLVDGSSLATFDRAVVRTAELADPRTVLIETAGRLPDPLCPGDGVESLDAHPDVLVTGCHATRNRARGLLLSSRGDVLVERNRIALEGTAVKISGDMRKWYEAGGVRNVTIRDNDIEVRNTPGTFGRAVVDIDPEVGGGGRAGYVHRDVTITGNRIRTAYRDLVHARSVRGLTVTDNVVERLPGDEGLVPGVRLQDCADVTVDDDVPTARTDRTG